MRNFLLFIVVLVLSNGSLHAQSNKELYDGMITAFNQGDYKACKKLSASVIEKSEEKDTTYLNALNYGAYAKFYLEEYGDAFNDVLREAELRKKYSSSEDERYLSAEYSIGVFSSYAQEYQTGLEHMKIAEAGFRKIYGVDNAFYLGLLSNLAILHEWNSELDRASEIYDEVVIIAQRNFKAGDPNYNNPVYAANVFYTKYGYNEKAEPLHLEALDLTKQVYGEMSQPYIDGLSSLIDFYLAAGWMEKLEGIYKERVRIIEENEGRKGENYEVVFSDLVAFYGQLGWADKLETAYQHHLKLTEKEFGKNSEQYALALNTLGEQFLNMGAYQKCFEVFQEFVAISLKVYGEVSADYATSLNNLAVAQEKLAHYDEAEKLYKQALEIKGKVFRTNSDYYALSLGNLAVLYQLMGRYGESKELLNQAIEIYENEYKGKHENYPVVLNSLSYIYTDEGQYMNALRIQNRACQLYVDYGLTESAEYYNAMVTLGATYLEAGMADSSELILEKAIDKLDEVIGVEHPNYSIALGHLAQAKTQLLKYDEAENLLKSALEIQKEKVGEEHPTYIRTLNGLAILYHEMGLIAAAGELYRKLLRIGRKCWGESHPEYAILLNNAGLFYFETGEIDDAEQTLLQAYNIHLKTRGEGHPEAINYLVNLALVYTSREYFERAENYYLQALKIAEEVYGRDHMTYASTLNSLGAFYYEMGQFEKSESYYKLAVDRSKATYGEGHHQTISALSNLGTLYMRMSYLQKEVADRQRLVDEAEEYLLQCLKLDSAIGRQEHPDHAIHLNNLAELYRTHHFRKLALKLHEKAFEIEKNAFGENSPQLAVAYGNLGLIYFETGELEKGLEFNLKALDLKKKVYGSGSTNLIGNYQNLIDVYEAKGNKKAAYQAYQQAFELYFLALSRNLGFLSEEEKENFFQVYGGISRTYFYFLLENPGLDAEMSSMGYNAAIKDKGILLRSAEKLQQQVREAGDPKVQAIYEDWLSVKQRLAKLYTMNVEGVEDQISELESSGEQLEKKLIEKLNTAGTNFTRQPDWKDIQNALETDEAAIEFVVQMHGDTAQITVFKYAALLIRKDAKQPIAIDLPLSKDLFDYLSSQKGDNLTVATSIYGSKDKYDEEIYKLVWQPLEAHLTGINRIYYSPTSYIHKLSLAAVRDDKGMYLSEKYQLRQLISTASLADPSSANEMSNADLIVFGGAEFSTDQSQKEIWTYLSGTKQEAEAISQLASSENIECKSFTGSNASEKNFKEATKSDKNHLLHLATHGFFYDTEELVLEEAEEEDEVAFRGASRGHSAFVVNPNPLMRSGLALSGANDVWNEKSTDETVLSDEQEDGVLTAYEVANLDLSSTQLVVLSACETGLGEIRGSQGVYGLQRAFRIAGVQRMIMSLWQVPDKETSEFMTHFYQQLFELNDVAKAFAAAQKLMREKYDPYYWAAFVLIE